MKHGTAIEWTHIPGFKGETWNPIRAAGPEGGRRGWHCEHVSEGCRNCYAETMNAWRGTGLAFKPGNRETARLYLDDATLEQPLHWRDDVRRSVFVCSMSDLFGEFVPDDWIAFVVAVAALAPRHVFIVLTKRPERMRTLLADEEFRGIVDTYVSQLAIEHSDPLARRRDDLRATAPDLVYDDGAWPLPNVWCGTSAENQETFCERQPALFRTPAARRFMSLEPLLGPVDVAPFLTFCPTHDSAGGFCVGPCPDRRRLDWVIAGGESGPKARPMHPDWPRDLRDQCAAAGVPCFFKQRGG